MVLGRRGFLSLLALAATSFAATRSRGQPRLSSSTLLDVPFTLEGEWGQSAPRDVAAVVFRMRQACLAGARLLSDRQPSALRIENRRSGNPAIWLHDSRSTTAWIVVNVGTRDWSKLAYQFGHELGHVLANSWDAASKPRKPCQWLEEALVEAFSLRGLGRLADSWERRPPFPNDAPFASAIRRYRRNIVERCEKAAAEQMPDLQPPAWFERHRSALEGEAEPMGPGALIPAILRELESEVRNVEDLGGLNRWPGRSAVPIEQYVRLWEKSCAEIGAAAGLPRRIHDLLGLGR